MCNELIAWVDAFTFLHRIDRDATLDCIIEAAFLNFGVSAADLDSGDLARDYVAGRFTKSLGGLRSFRGEQDFGTENKQCCYERPGHQAETLLHRRPFIRWRGAPNLLITQPAPNTYRRRDPHDPTS